MKFKNVYETTNENFENFDCYSKYVKKCLKMILFLRLMPKKRRFLVEKFSNSFSIII